MAYENVVETTEYVEQNAKHKLTIFKNNKTYYIDIDKDEQLFLNSKENGNYIVIEIDRKRYENIPQEIQNDLTYMLCFNACYDLKTSYDYQEIHFFDLKEYPDFVMQPFKSVDEVGINQCFRVTYYPHSSKMIFM